jgi:hypothetical protein
MNFNKKQLEEIKKIYQSLVWVIVKNNKWGKKLPFYIQQVLDQHNLIINLIEDIEELNNQK